MGMSLREIIAQRIKNQRCILANMVVHGPEKCKKEWGTIAQRIDKDYGAMLALCTKMSDEEYHSSKRGAKNEEPKVEPKVKRTKKGETGKCETPKVTEAPTPDSPAATNE
jgi:hypothetical protein